MKTQRELLLERVVAAWRARDPVTGGARSEPAWHDLDDAGRREAHHIAIQQRQLESALDPEGLSSTSRAVLARIRRS